MKEHILNLKNHIKELNVEQKSDKIQRKTDRFPEGFKRTKPAWQATEDVLERRHTLKVLYHIYNKMRNRPEVHPEVENEWGYTKFELEWMPAEA